MKKKHLLKLGILAIALTALPCDADAQSEVNNNCSVTDTLQTYECCPCCKRMLKKADVKYMDLVVISMQALLSTGTPLTDKVDTGNGVYLAADGNYIRDHIWVKGGYGVLTYLEGFRLRSTIACLKALEKAYGRERALEIYYFFCPKEQ